MRQFPKNMPGREEEWYELRTSSCLSAAVNNLYIVDCLISGRLIADVSANHGEQEDFEDSLPDITYLEGSEDKFKRHLQLRR
jgi:hypothetical protein